MIKLRRRAYAGLSMLLSSALAISGMGLEPPKTPQDRSVDSKAGITLKKPTETPAVRFMPSPGLGLQLALADSLSVPLLDKPFTRYLFVPSGSVASMKTVSWGLQFISRSSGVYRPVPVAGGVLLRLDLRWYAERREDLQEWLALWEELAFDPMFSLLLTRDNLKFLTPEAKATLPRKRIKKNVVRQILVPGVEKEEEFEESENWGHYEDKFGRTHDDFGKQLEKNSPGAIWKTTEIKKVNKTRKVKAPDTFKEVTEVIESEQSFNLDDVDVVRLNPPILEPALTELQITLSTQVPVVDYRYFLTRALTSIEDDGPYKFIYGGLYYKFKGIKKAKDVLGKDTKATDLDLFFETIGIGNIKAGLGQEKIFEKLRSDMRLVVFRSQVTGSVREVSMFHSLADKEGGSWGAITGDLKRKKIDIGDRAYANLLTPHRDAREAIWPGANGFNIFALFNEQGNLQEKAPDDVVNDTTVPKPFPQELQSAISCLRCHYSDGSDGWKPLENDIKKMMSSKRLDIFGDLSNPDQFDTVARIAGLFQGDFSKPLRRARDDVADTTLRATGPWSEVPEDLVGKEDLRYIAKTSGLALEKEFNGYNYGLVDAQQALWEMGLDVRKDKAVIVLRMLLLPDGRAAIGDIFLEDPRAGALKEGIGINRSDWALFQVFAYERVQRSLTVPVIKKLLIELK